MKFVHKDKVFFDAICTLFPSFSKRFQDAREEQWEDGCLSIAVNRSGVEDFFWHIEIPKTDIEKIELKPYKWYPREEFDGNPNNYWIVEQVHWSKTVKKVEIYHIQVKHLHHASKKFMYIEPAEE